MIQAILLNLENMIIIETLVPCQLEIQLKKKEIKLEINYTVLCITGAISSNSSEEISGFSSDRKNNVAKLILDSYLYEVSQKDILKFSLVK